jgi:hypothetical protein
LKDVLGKRMIRALAAAASGCAIQQVEGVQKRVVE